MRHGTVRVRRQRLLEAGDSFLMVVAKAPVEATLEPSLGIRRAGGHLPGVRPEIIGVVHIASLSIPGKVGPRPRLFACRAQPRSAGRNVAKSLPRRAGLLDPIAKRPARLREQTFMLKPVREMQGVWQLRRIAGALGVPKQAFPRRMIRRAFTARPGSPPAASSQSSFGEQPCTPQDMARPPSGRRRGEATAGAPHWI